MKINELKSKIWDEFLQESSPRTPGSFADIYSALNFLPSGESLGVKVQSVFLTLLHLSNEKNLTIVEDGGDLKVFTAPN